MTTTFAAYLLAGMGETREEPAPMSDGLTADLNHPLPAPKPCPVVEGFRAIAFHREGDTTSAIHASDMLASGFSGTCMPWRPLPLRCRWPFPESWEWGA